LIGALNGVVGTRLAEPRLAPTVAVVRRLSGRGEMSLRSGRISFRAARTFVSPIAAVMVFLGAHPLRSFAPAGLAVIGLVGTRLAEPGLAPTVAVVRRLSGRGEMSLRSGRISFRAARTFMSPIAAVMVFLGAHPLRSFAPAGLFCGLGKLIGAVIGLVGTRLAEPRLAPTVAVVRRLSGRGEMSLRSGRISFRAARIFMSPIAAVIVSE
jgi:hypothetical protein